MQMSGLRIIRFSYFGKSSLLCMCSRYTTLNVYCLITCSSIQKRCHFCMSICFHIGYLASSLSKHAIAFLCGHLNIYVHRCWILAAVIWSWNLFSPHILHPSKSCWMVEFQTKKCSILCIQFNILRSRFIQLKFIWLCCSWMKMVLVRNQVRMIRSQASMSGLYLPKNSMVCGKGKYCLSLTTLISIYVLWMISMVFAAYYMKLVSSRGCWDMLPVLCFLLKEVWIHVWFRGTGKHLQ